MTFEHYLLQPVDGEDLAKAIAAAVAYCQANPKWRLSMQVHKIVGLK